MLKKGLQQLAIFLQLLWAFLPGILFILFSHVFFTGFVQGKDIILTGLKSRQTGLFFADTISLTQLLSAEVGLRWNHTYVDLRDQIGTALNGTHRFRRLNPGVEFDYALTDHLSLRGGYAETSRAPTPAELSCADEAAPCSLTNFFVGDPPLEQVVGKTSVQVHRLTHLA